MKEALFDAVADVGETLLSALQYIFNFVIVALASTFAYIIKIIANIFKFILLVIHPDKVRHAEQVILQMPLNTELDILMGITKVKEDALAHKAWGDEHSIALNELGSRLYHECKWEKNKIHDYMRALVESIPGLTYLGGDDDDYDDDDDGSEVEV